MDVEKTINFIVDQQANWEVRWAKADARMDKNERQIEGILKLLKMGAKQFALDAKRANRIDARLDQISEDLAAMTGKMNILIDAQIRADERLGLLEKKANGRGIKPARKRPGPKQ